MGMFVMVWFVAKKEQLPRSPYKGGWKSFKKELYPALPAILMPVFVIGTLRFGLATPTEVSVMAVAYALVIGIFIYKDLSKSIVLESLYSTAMMTGAVMIVIMASSAIQWVLTAEQIPQMLALWVSKTIVEPWLIILALNIIMLVVGCFLDLPAAILLLAPIFIVIAKSIGLDPVQLGLMMVVNLSIGLYTPPVGTTLFISTAIAKVGILQTVRSLMPFYLVALFILCLISYIPALTIY
jgi:tripartite ATP-independent transporter DctM subunit